MTEEEYFIKNYPDFCYGDKPLSPYWDLFEYGAEFGERQSEKKIEELTSELTKKADIKLTKAKEILQVVLDKWKKDRWILYSDEKIKQIENLMEQTEQFLREIEK